MRKSIKTLNRDDVFCPGNSRVVPDEPIRVPAGHLVCVDSDGEPLDSTHAMRTVNPSEDGRRHINIYSTARTVLGRKLSNFSYRVFIHPTLGRFNSMEGLYYYVSTGCSDERFRRLYGIAAKQAGRKLLKVKRDDFDELMRMGIQACYLADPSIREEMVAQIAVNNGELLPFVHYYEYAGKVKVPSGNMWLVEEWDAVRDHVVMSADGEIELRDGRRYAVMPESAT